jgi:hypothetical protein
VNPKIWSAATDPRNYQELFRERGAVFLLESDKAPDFDELDDVSPETRRRLKTVIERSEEFFVLTGSDPAQKDGCCPSNEVGEANKLVRAGLLSSSIDATNADCPATIYAFAAEIRKFGDKPGFVRNERLRIAIKDRIERGPRLSRKLMIRLGLVIVLAASLAVAAVTVYRQFRGH